MEKKKINASFVEAIKTTIKGSLIESLEEMICIGKESVYRRLRGDVMFSYPEAVLIAQNLNISLDEINFVNNGSFRFNVSRASKTPLDQAYADYITFGISNIVDYPIHDISNLYFAGTNIPIVFTHNYNYLSRFRYFKWLHENRGLEPNRNKLCDTIMPKHLYELSIVFLQILREMKSTYMLSDNMIENYIKEIKHFIYLGLIGQQDIDIRGIT